MISSTSAVEALAYSKRSFGQVPTQHQLR